MDSSYLFLNKSKEFILLFEGETDILSVIEDRYPFLFKFVLIFLKYSIGFLFGLNKYDSLESLRKIKLDSNVADDKFYWLYSYNLSF